MKQIIFLLAILTSLTAFTQTVVSYREATLNDSPSYTLDGIAYIEELSNGTFRFRLSSTYSTQSGPDVQIFMTNNATFATPINTTGALFVQDVGTGTGGINHFSGAYSIILPGISSLSDFDHVVFTCVGFGNLHWGNGSFGTTITNCVVTTSSLTEAVCGGYTAPSGQIFNSSGVVTDIIPNTAGCDSIITINLTVNTVDITTTQLSNVITANATGATYQWINCSSMNAIVVGETNQSYSITGNDSYAVIVTQNGCSDTSSCANFCVATAASTTETVCGDYTAPSGQVFNSSGVVTDVIPNAAGCDSIITINLTVNTVDITITLLNNIATASATGATYQWINCSSMNAIVVGETNQSYTLTDNDNYAVIVTQNGCTDTSSCINTCETTSFRTEIVCGEYTAPSGQVFTTSGIVTDVIPNAEGCDSIITIDLTVNIVDVTTTLLNNVATANALGTTYQWITCSPLNTILTGETNQSYSITDNGSYAVIISQNGCSDTSLCIDYTSAGVEENSFGANLSIYPNPAKNKVTLSFDDNINHDFEVYNSIGKQIYNESFYGDKVVYNTSKLPNGIYYIKTHINGVLVTKRLVIQ